MMVVVAVGVSAALDARNEHAVRRWSSSCYRRRPAVVLLLLLGGRGPGRRKTAAAQVLSVSSVLSPVPLQHLHNIPCAGHLRCRQRCVACASTHTRDCRLMDGGLDAIAGGRRNAWRRLQDFCVISSDSPELFSISHLAPAFRSASAPIARLFEAMRPRGVYLR